jgi:hypothetical protein
VTTSGNDKVEVKRQRAILEEAILKTDKTDVIGGERSSERQGKTKKKWRNGMIGGGKEPMRAEKTLPLSLLRGY